MSAKVRCLVIGCKRHYSGRLPYPEWICQKHWQLVPKVLRRVYKRIKKEARSHGWTVPLMRRAARCWMSIVMHAQQAALGL